MKLILIGIIHECFFFLVKERILATCEENKLEYMDDPTNFQPQLTIRNAIRHCINSEEKEKLDSAFTQYPADIATLLTNINKAAAGYPELNISLSGDREHLRQVVKDLAKELAEVDATGLSSDLLTRCKILNRRVQWMNFFQRTGDRLLLEVLWYQLQHSSR